MFEDLTTKGVLFSILFWAFSTYVLPRFLATDTVKKAVKVVDRNVDVLEGDADFDWKEAKPVAYRPFKPIYYVTMGISKTKQSDWLRIENTYDRVTKYRAEVADAEPEEVCIIDGEPRLTRKQSQATAAAVEELYDEVLTFLVKKYPMYFVKTGKTVTNLIKNTQFPRRAADRNKSQVTPRDLLRILNDNVEEDFLIMQYDDKAEEYVLRALTGVGANGFRSSQKLGRILTKIHEPVPQYIAKLQLSINRHFRRIAAGEYTQRLTWGIQVGGEINEVFRPSGMHLSKDEKAVELSSADLDFANGVFVRVERQVLTRLKKSQFIVLSVRTYMYPLADIKREGEAPALAKAIRAWPEDVAHYKGRPRWGNAVLSYLDK